MNIKKAVKKAKALGALFQKWPHSFSAQQREALEYYRGIILKYHIKKLNKKLK